MYTFSKLRHTCNKLNLYIEHDTREREEVRVGWGWVHRACESSSANSIAGRVNAWWTERTITQSVADGLHHQDQSAHNIWQCCQTCPPQTKIGPRYSPSGKTTLAPCWGPYPLQNCHTSFQALWELSSSIPFRTASHLPTLSNSSVQQWKTFESPQN